jgi:hypothetical protein
MWLRQFDRGDHNTEVVTVDNIAEWRMEKAVPNDAAGPTTIEISPLGKAPILLLVINNVK